MSPMPGAILFDLDDTILEFHALAAPAWKATLESMADQLQGQSPDRVLQAVDRVSREWWSDPERHRQGRLDLAGTRRKNVAEALISLSMAADTSPDGLVSEIVEEFERRRFDGLRLFPGAKETLDHFRAAGVPLALVTNGDGPGQRAKIERFGLAPYFDCILIEGEFGVGKPDTRVFLHVLERLDVSPSDAWMVGDRLEWEILPTQQLGLHAVWVDVTGSGIPPELDIQPDRTVRSIVELVGDAHV